MKKDYLNRIYGSAFILTFLFLTFSEYERILNPVPDFVASERYIDYSILLYLSRWIIYLLLLIAGLAIFFKSKRVNLFLLIFSVTVLLEIYFNNAIYIIKSLIGYPKYILFGLSILCLVVVGFSLLKTKKTSFIEIFLSFILAITIVYLPNALITFYF
jgi:hypothetical protein